ncbi:hypothetical protein [Sorangium sp. So ce513]|uniref:hypothetical protein n=1 Tax=Sorangium sp. So ce513 TaxID=3133315 RepID=UPI003F5D9E3C
MTTLVGRPRDLLPGERLLAVHPPLAPDVDAGWHRRLNLFTGRSLSHLALEAEQAGRGGRLATTGQYLAPGVVAGLEVDLARDADGAPVLQLAPGYGVALSGEDVLVAQPRAVRLADVPVFGAAPLPPAEGESPADRRVPSLGALQAAGVALPRAFVLVLEPVVMEVAGRFDPEDPCEQDPAEYAYEDRQHVDAARLWLYPWPDGYPAVDPDAPTARNALAYAVFDAERALPDGGYLPWEALGLPVGLLALRHGPPVDAPFVDRSAVARRGGASRSRAPLVAGAGAARLWQARFEQLAEHVASLDIADLVAGGLASRFRWLPPVGVLPPGVMTLRSATPALPADPLFPPGFAVEALPVPIEALDDVLRASAPLAPIDLHGLEQVQVLVPVPQAWYDPKLLVVEALAPEFADTIALFRWRLADRLAHRSQVREAASLLARATDGALAKYDPDPDAVDGEEASPPLPEGADPGAEALPPEPDFLSDLKNILSELTKQLSGALGQVPGSPPSPRYALLIERFTTPPRGGDPGPLEPSLADFNGIGITGFLQKLKQLIDDANDRLDFSFLKVNTDAYRIRQYVVGNTPGTRLATSSVLSQLARSVVVAPTVEKIEGFAAFLKKSPDVDPTSPTPPIVLPRSAVRARSGAGGLVPMALEAAADAKLAVTATPEMGPPVHFGTAQITDRLEVPIAPEAQQAALGSKVQAAEGLLGLHDGGLDLSGLRFPGFRAERDEKLTLSIDEIREPGVLEELRAGRYDTPRASDEASFFSAGVRSLEDAIASMRLVEGRVEQYEAARAACEATRKALEALRARVDQRLAALQTAIAEARQDVRVAEALAEEEGARLAALNARRQKIVDEHVPYLVFRRPRTVDGLAVMPSRALDPGLAVDPVPACQAHRAEAPDQLRAMVDLLRDAPVTWFPPLAAAVDRLDRVESLQQTLYEAVQRARLAPPEIRKPFSTPAFGTPQGLPIQQVFAAQQAALLSLREARAAFDLTAVAATWKGARQQADQIVSLGDLLQARHGRSDASRLAAEELEDISRVAACLFDRFRGVPALLRLRWAEQLGQFDARPDLRRLSNLPGWGELDRLERLGMQALVDWLFQRIDDRRPGAVALVVDIVRVALLLASHAPVNRILTGDVIRPEPVSPGGRLRVQLDVSLVRVGMHVLLFGQGPAGAPVGRGVVDDVGAGVAEVKVVGTSGGAAVSALRVHVLEPSQVAAAGGVFTVGPAGAVAR